MAKLKSISFGFIFLCHTAVSSFLLCHTDYFFVLGYFILLHLKMEWNPARKFNYRWGFWWSFSVLDFLSCTHRLCIRVDLVSISVMGKIDWKKIWPLGRLLPTKFALYLFVLFVITICLYNSLFMFWLVASGQHIPLAAQRKEKLGFVQAWIKCRLRSFIPYFIVWSVFQKVYLSSR